MIEASALTTWVCALRDFASTHSVADGPTWVVLSRRIGEAVGQAVARTTFGRVEPGACTAEVDLGGQAGGPRGGSPPASSSLGVHFGASLAFEGEDFGVSGVGVSPGEVSVNALHGCGVARVVGTEMAANRLA